MIHNALRKLKAGLSFLGPSKTADGEGAPLFSASEIALLRQQLKENSDAATDAVRRAGAKPHPRITALRAKG
jgi:hypothetical protein